MDRPFLKTSKTPTSEKFAGPLPMEPSPTDRRPPALVMEPPRSAPPSAAAQGRADAAKGALFQESKHDRSTARVVENGEKRLLLEQKGVENGEKRLLLEQKGGNLSSSTKGNRMSSNFVQFD